MSLKGLYAITDEHLTPDATIIAHVTIALQSGVKILQYRNKTATDGAIETVCRQLQHLCTAHNAVFILDDRPYLAQKIGADGLHIGKDDMELSRARAIFPQGIIGVSCYGSIKKAIEAQEQGADYVAFGSFFPSPTKPHSGVVSLSVLERAKNALSIPICAIGGINVTNIHDVAAHKPDMISLVSAIWEGDIRRTILQLNQGMNVY